MKWLSLSLLVLLSPSALAGNCTLQALNGSVVMDGREGHMERTLLYRAVCETTSDARLSVNTDLDGTLTLHGLSQSVKASLFIDGEIATEPVSLVVGPDGRVIEVRIVIHDGGIHLAADDYKTHITATLDY